MNIAKSVVAALILGFVIAIDAIYDEALAQQTLTSEELLNMLQNKASAPERSLSPTDLEKAQQNRITVEKAGSGQDITVDERQKLADMARERPNVDLEVYFAYNSDAITPQAMRALIPLGQALANDRLARATFLIAGHTDAVGDNAYNLKLSQRRARAVKDFLASTFDIDPRRLVAIGHGEEELKNHNDPEAAENRRVQVVNLGDIAQQSSR